MSRPRKRSFDKAIQAMTLESALLAAVSAVVSALVYVSSLLWQRSQDCERDRRELRDEIEKVKEANGESRGRLTAFERCPKAECPFRSSKGAVLVVALSLSVSGCASIPIRASLDLPTPAGRFTISADKNDILFGFKK